VIAAVAFDAPLSHAFDYRIPDGWTLAPGQRVRAPLAGATRVGLVLAVRDAPAEGLKALHERVDPVPILDPAGLDLIRWISERSLSSVGSTAAGLLPPPLVASAGPSPTRAPRDAGLAAPDVPSLPELFTGPGRERRLLDEITKSPAGALVVVPEVDAAVRWAQRLSKIGPVVRLDSAVDDSERARAWAALDAGRVRLAVGTRSALLAPVAPGAIVALIDEHEAAHRPPGHPRIHAREVLLERARRESVRLVLTSGTPSVEMWWRTTRRLATRVTGDWLRWPTVVIADTRGVLRREPITPELARALRETLAAGGRAFLAVSRFASALACDECGLVLRCAACGIALGYSRAAATLVCRLCRSTAPLPTTCPACQGRRLSPFGWGVERVEHAVKRRFPHARVARYEPERRRARAGNARTEAAAADIVIGTRGALRLFGPASLGVAGFVAPDQLLRVPEFRAGERMLSLVWAAAERVRAGGQVVIQSQNPSHHAFAAVAAHAMERFYEPELRFRAELGYPPFRRLAVVTVRQGQPHDESVARAVAEALRAAPGLTVYPPAPLRRERAARIVVKGGEDLAHVVAHALETVARGSRPNSRSIIDAEVDPVEWPS
jgi:primosomal protein N' (replication factor Y) (superfamily II helicase)